MVSFKDSSFSETLKNLVHDPYSFDALQKDDDSKRVILPFIQTASRETQETEAISMDLNVLSLWKSIQEITVGDEELPRVLRETTDVLKATTDSNGAYLYMVNAAAKEIYLVSERADNERDKVTWRIQSGTTVAAYVAYSKEYVMVEDALGDPRFPDGVEWFGKKAGPVICVPVLAHGEQCVAVIELYRDSKYRPYKKTDQQMAAAVVSWMGTAIHNNAERVLLLKQQTLNEHLLQAVNSYFQTEQASPVRILSQIVSYAKLVLEAECSQFYIVDQESDGIVADVYEEGIVDEIYRRKSRVRLHRDKSVAGYAARTVTLMNIQDVREDRRFQEIVSQDHNIIIRSVICMPIREKEAVLGVIQLMNKTNGICFTDTDEKLLDSFSMYSVMVLDFSRSQGQLHKAEKRGELFENMIKRYMAPEAQFVDKLTSFKLQVPENFSSFEWYHSNLEGSIAPFVVFMLKDVCQKWFLDDRQICEFVAWLQNAYQEIPYHNFEHAVKVTHCMYIMLKKNASKFSDIEVCSLMVAALSVDLDHPGFTNSFLRTTSHPIFHLYNESYLENHHYYISMFLLQSCNLFTQLQSKVYQQITKEIYDAIMATDLQFYFRVREKFILHSDTFDWSIPLHKMYLKSLMMTACSFCGYSKSVPVSRNIVQSMYTEFYIQAEEEKKLGITPLSMMDSNNKDMIAEDQLQFINVIYLPCLKLLKKCLSGIEELVTLCEGIMKYWQEIVDMKDQKVWRQDESLDKD